MSNDRDLQRLAQEKLKEINGAYQFVLANLFADKTGASGATPEPPPGCKSAVTVDSSTGKRRNFWAAWGVALLLVAALCALFWSKTRNQGKILPTAPVESQLTAPVPDQDQSQPGPTSQETIKPMPAATVTVQSQSQNQPVVSPPAPAAPRPQPDPPAPVNAKPVPMAPGRIVADYVVTVADDFVVDIYLNGKRVTDGRRTLADEVYGATSEKVDIPVREGDWLVFNVVNDRFRWNGVYYFAAAGIHQNGVLGFVSELKSDHWSCCDDVAEAARFIAEPDYLASNRARPVLHPWDRGNATIKRMAKGWAGDPLWGTSRNTWIKYRVPRPPLVK